MSVKVSSIIDIISNKLDEPIVDFEKNATLHETKEKYSKFVFGLVPIIQSFFLPDPFFL